MLQVQHANILTINHDFAGFELHDARDSGADSGLSSTSSTNDSNLFAWFDCEAELIQDDVGVLPVAEDHVLKVDTSLSWPLCCSLLGALELFLGNVLKLEYSLNLDHHSLDPVEGAEDAVEGPVEVEAAAEEH